MASNEKQILVDSGVYTYKAGSERNECRSTKRHNTIEIDNIDSAEIWSAFRVAKRGHTEIVEKEIDNNGFSILARHDGYAKILKDGTIHERHVKLNSNECLVITDRIINTKKHTAVLRFNIGPECVVRMLNEYTCMIDENIVFKCNIPIDVQDTEVAFLFGIKQTTKCIVASFETTKVNQIDTIINILD